MHVSAIYGANLYSWRAIRRARKTGAIKPAPRTIQPSDAPIRYRLGMGVLFYECVEWKMLRRGILKHYGRECMKCGSGRHIQVDHIKPRSKYPHLELEQSNLQVLCKACNMVKSNKNETDWRRTKLVRGR